MSKLVELLNVSKIEQKTEKHKVRKSDYLTESTSETVKIDDSLFSLTDEQLEKIKGSVVTLSDEAMNSMSRDQIIIGMYGGIKDPETGNRFVIPYLDFTDENYVFKYADMMKTLVHKPETFTKIMNWE